MDEANGYFDYSGGVDLNLSYRGYCGSVKPETRVVSMLDSLHLAKVFEGDLAWP